MKNKTIDIYPCVGSTKFCKRKFGHICWIEEIDHVVTDKGVVPHVAKVTVVCYTYARGCTAA